MGIEFKPSPTHSLGMEWELQLLDPVTLALVDGILPLLEQEPCHPGLKPEYNQSTVEVVSGVCPNVQTLEADIVSTLHTLKARCAKLGIRVCGGGTHPFNTCLANVTPLPRYLELQRAGRYLSDMLMTFAIHVHVGIPSGDDAIAVMRQLKPYLPILLALSANSPFWWGRDTGYASYRQRYLSSTRTYGLPPTFQNWKEFAHFFNIAQYAHIFKVIRDIHWDIRPQPDLGTLEVRAMDAPAKVSEAMRLVAFAHTLIVYLHQLTVNQDTGFQLSPLPWLIEKENYFRASRWGLAARYISDEQGHSFPIRAIVPQIVEALMPTAEQLGTTDHLHALTNSLSSHPSYARQRIIFQETGSLYAIVADLVSQLDEELEQSCPRPMVNSL
jgi:glutamate---cysteine ligase / carboxylate-amine ligase